MFSAQQNKGHPPSKPLSSPVLSQSSFSKVIKKVETKFELQTQAAHDLGKLLRLKTISTGMSYLINQAIIVVIK